MYYQIFDLIQDAFFNAQLDPASFEWLFTTGCSMACCIAVVAVPVCAVISVIRLVFSWR